MTSAAYAECLRTTATFIATVTVMPLHVLGNT
jgi:hypothetical protein